MGLLGLESFCKIGELMRDLSWEGLSILMSLIAEILRELPEEIMLGVIDDMVVVIG